MPVEQGDRPFTPRSVWSTGNGRNCSVVAERASALLNGKSRVSREAQARFREGLGVQFPGATRPSAEAPLARCSFLVAGLLLRWRPVLEERDGGGAFQDRVDQETAVASNVVLTALAAVHTTAKNPCWKERHRRTR